MNNKWTHAHCERCYDAENPRLITDEIFCAPHYREWLAESTEETNNNNLGVTQ